MSIEVIGYFSKMIKEKFTVDILHNNDSLFITLLNTVTYNLGRSLPANLGEL